MYLFWDSSKLEMLQIVGKHKNKECKTSMNTHGLEMSKLLADLKNQPVESSCVTHILPFCSCFKGQEQLVFNPTSWHLVTYNFL